jgi:hypothetical protein
MFEYFSNVKKRDVAHRQKFVIVGTTLSFLLILGIWIPFELMQLKSMAGKGVVAENKVDEASPSPVVAGDTTTRTLPFLSGAKTSPEAFVSPTATPDFETDTPLINESSPEPVSATPATSDFPTL